MEEERIVVVGLGYVGLPLAVALARHFPVVGIDIDEARVAELRQGHDRTGEVEPEELEASTLKVSADPEEGRGADVYIVTVPTPVDTENRPDLRAIFGASRMVARLIERDRRPVIVFESTVYPGVTEEECGPIIAAESGLVAGRDFFLGYSPERINPGDREHRVDRIVKVVAGETAEVTDRIARIYGQVTSAGVYRASSIKVAEAAKVIENAQRDINIAFMNEITRIFARLDISVWDVLDAAATKWNFLKFQPGLVGGHCIGVDPYYLSHRAQQLGHEPQVILAGRTINDSMAHWVAQSLHARRGGRAGTALVLGLTFKEDVPDLRNSKVADLVGTLRSLGHDVSVHDPLADPAEAREEHGIELDPAALERTYDLVVVAVAHEAYRRMEEADISRLVAPGGCIADLKGLWRRVDPGRDVDRWSL